MDKLDRKHIGVCHPHIIHLTACTSSAVLIVVNVLCGVLFFRSLSSRSNNVDKFFLLQALLNTATLIPYGLTSYLRSKYLNVLQKPGCYYYTLLISIQWCATLNNIENFATCCVAVYQAFHVALMRKAMYGNQWRRSKHHRKIGVSRYFWITVACITVLITLFSIPQYVGLHVNKVPPIGDPFRQLRQSYRYRFAKNISELQIPHSLNSTDFKNRIRSALSRSTHNINSTIAFNSRLGFPVSKPTHVLRITESRPLQIAMFYIGGFLFKIVPCLVILITVPFTMTGLSRMKEQRIFSKIQKPRRCRSSHSKQSSPGSLAGRHHMRATQSQSNLRKHLKLNRNKMLLAIVLSFTVTQAPIGIINVVNLHVDVIREFYVFCGVFLDVISLLNSSVCLVVYSCASSRFRRYVKSIHACQPVRMEMTSSAITATISQKTKSESDFHVKHTPKWKSRRKQKAKTPIGECLSNISLDTNKTFEWNEKSNQWNIPNAETSNEWNIPNPEMELQEGDVML